MTVNYNDFVHLYSVQKTLRFELKPVGKTFENIKAAELIKNDEKLAEKYKTAKKIIDRFHRKHIEESLFSADLTVYRSILQEYQHLYLKSDKDEKEKDELGSIQKKLRSVIVSFLSGGAQNDNQNMIKDRYGNLFTKELFDNQEFLSMANSQEENDALHSFKRFRTYFVGFHENRKNMYSADEESTAIAYRIIHENLPRFADNIARFSKVTAEIDKEDILRLLTNLKEECGEYELADIFSLEYFQNTLSQNGITKYNTIIGGKTTEDGKKIQGLNEIINLFNQRHDAKRLPLLKPLYKQILSEELSSSFRISALEKDKDVLEAVQELWDTLIVEAAHSVTGKKYNMLDSVKDLMNGLDKLSDSDLEQMYFESSKITALSHEVYGQWNVIRDALDLYSGSRNNGVRKMSTKAKEKDHYSWKEIKDALSCYKQSLDDASDFDEMKFIAFFKEMKINTGVLDNRALDMQDVINEAYNKVKETLQEERGGNSSLHQEKEKVALIKEFLDSLKELQRFLRLLHTEAVFDNMNYTLYDELAMYYETLKPVNNTYNKVRNYMTRKPYSVEKFALTFESATLLHGWDLNKETDNLGIILRKEGLYYLGIMNRQYNKIFRNYEKTNSDDAYEKMIYKLLPGPNKMLPKVFFSDKGKKYYKPTDDILEIYKNNEFKKGDSFNKKSLHALIDFYIDAISKNEDWNVFEFRFKAAHEYEDISKFYSDVEKQGYKIIFDKISSRYVDTLVNEGKLNLFQIYSKDFSPYSKGSPNLHTIYWKNLFMEENLSNVVYKLNGEAEVFYRKKSIEYDEEIRNIGHHADKLKEKFYYPIIKDKRYSDDKFLFHVPITMNFNAKGETNVNKKVKDYFATAKEDIHIIGIDRGERHLLYLSLIDLKGNIVKQESLNLIRIGKHDKVIDYRKKLDEKEKQRNEARQNWDVVENIKELKEGYLSQIVHKIAQLMVEHKAILVMEDLNTGFKRGRFKVEKQVYQKFEKMLIDKLNFLVLKDKNTSEAGGSFKAYQLTAPFISFKKLGKQSGMIFYVPAQYTSKIDPTTGFHNFLKIDTSSLQAAKESIGKFYKIAYNKTQEYFEFHCRYADFVSESQKYSKSKKVQDAIHMDAEWVVCSTSHDRFKVQKENGSIQFRRVNANEELKRIFKEEGIDYEHSKDLKDDILSSSKTQFVKQIGEQVKLLAAMRYNNGKKGNDELDYILSPVKNRAGRFFYTLDNDVSLPVDADANGAYNIALKGLMLVERMRESRQSDGKTNLFISNLDWIGYLIKKQNQISV